MNNFVYVEGTLINLNNVCAVEEVGGVVYFYFAKTSHSIAFSDEDDAIECVRYIAERLAINSNNNLIYGG